MTTWQCISTQMIVKGSKKCCTSDAAGRTKDAVF